MNRFVAFSLVVAVAMVTGAQACLFSVYRRAHLINELPSNSTMKIQCRAHGEDQGCYRLNVTHYFSWKYCSWDSFAPEKTECHIFWESNSKKVELNLMFFFPDKCTDIDEDCCWSAQADGIHFLDPFEDTIVFPWDPLEFQTGPLCSNVTEVKEMAISALLSAEGKRNAKRDLLESACVVAFGVVGVACACLFEHYKRKHDAEVRRRRQQQQHDGSLVAAE